MTADEARTVLANLGVSRYSYDKALDSAQIGGYYRIEMTDKRIYEVKFSSRGFRIEIE